MRVSRKKKQFFIGLGDFVCLSMSVFLALSIRNVEFPTFKSLYTHFFYFLPIMLFWIVAQYTAMMYSLERSFTSYRFFINLFIVATLSLLIGFALFYLTPNTVIMPKTTLLVYCITNYVVICLWRQLYTKFFTKNLSSINVAIVGLDSTVKELLCNMNRFSHMSYKIKYIYDEDVKTTECESIPIIHSAEDFTNTLKNEGIKLVVLTNEKILSQEATRTLFDLLQYRVKFFNIADFYELFLRKIPLGSINELWFLRNIDLDSKQLFLLFKRIFDIIFAIVCVCLTTPFWPFIMLIIKAESPGPVFFKQKRIGFQGKNFFILKFRTMRTDNNNLVPTEKNDPRITRFGNFLRKSRIDEIPQIVNILKGDMSLIGPRPERPELAVTLEQAIPYYRQRELVKPGITGWDQVSGEYHSPSVEDTYKKLQFDLYYIKNLSIFLDISIFFKTIFTVLKQAGR